VQPGQSQENSVSRGPEGNDVILGGYAIGLEFVDIEYHVSWTSFETLHTENPFILILVLEQINTRSRFQKLHNIHNQIGVNCSDELSIPKFE
jgi:hypothetical protein